MAFKHPLSFATILADTLVAIDSRIMPEIVFKLLRTAILSGCAFRLKSDQTPFSRKCRQFRSAAEAAAMHRIRLGLGTKGFVPIKYYTFFNLETTALRPVIIRMSGFGLSKGLAKSIEISFPMKKRHGPKQTQHINLFDSRTESVSQEWPHTFLKRAGRGTQRLPQTWKRPVFALARPASLARPQELGH